MIRRMIEHAELGLEWISYYVYSAFSHQRILVVSVEQSRQRLVTAMNGIENREARVTIPVLEAHQQHIGLSFHIGHEFRDEQIEMHLTHRGYQSCIYSSELLRLAGCEYPLDFHYRRMTAPREFSVDQLAHLIEQFMKRAVLRILNRMSGRE